MIMERSLLSPFVLLPGLLFAQAGTLDPSFSSDGLLVSSVSTYEDAVRAVMVQPDERTVGVGWIDDGSLILPFVHRLLQNGSPDPSFGIGGMVYFPVAGQLPYAYAVGMQSTGNIVVAGVIYDASLDGNAMVFRLLPDGSPDDSFSNNGLVYLDYGAGFGFQSAWAMQVMGDDRIVIVGENGESGIVCARLDAEGVPDPSFGTNGYAYAGVPFSTGLCVHVNTNGSVIAGGYRVDPNSESDWVLSRFDANGILDPTFGAGGTAILDMGGTDSEFMRGVDVLSDGRIAVCGYRNHNGPGTESIVALFASDGTPDPSFGTNGLIALPYSDPQWSQARSIVVGPDDKLIVAGFLSNSTPTTLDDFLLVRILTDGTLDPTFGNGGEVITDLSSANDRAYAMAIAPNGSIVLAGYATGSMGDAAYARYLNDIGTNSAEVDTDVHGLTIFPNPTSGLAQVTTTLGRNARVELIDASGRVVLRSQITGAGDLDLSIVADGIYQVQLQYSSGERTRTRLLVQH